jgi:hypothetical protein
MAIDACQHRFIDLALNVFPSHLNRLKSSLNSPVPMQAFARPKIGPATIALELCITDPRSGCYVFLDRQRPIYVGISRSVLSRIRQHVLGKTHSDASLAYLMAKRKFSGWGTREAAMQADDFQQAFGDAQSYLKTLNCAFISIPNALELYLFEAFAAMELDTAEWNTFVTH